MDLPESNTIAGVASLVTSLLMAPAVKALHRIARQHGERLDDHDERIEDLESPKPRRRRRK